MTRSTTAIFRANGQGFIQEMNKMSASTSRLERATNENFRKVQSQVAKLRASAAAAFGGFSAALAIREFGRFSEASTRVDNTLKAAGVTASEFKKELLSTAIEARAPLEALSSAFLRLNKIRADDGANVNLERAATIQRLARVGGSSSAEAASVSTQLAQALQSGFLAGDELKSLREAAPVELLKAIADQAGITVGELKKAGSEGKLTADLVLRAIDGLSKYSQEALKQLDITVAEATTNVRSALTVFVGEFDRELGATSNIAQTLNGFASLLSENEAVARTLAASFKVLGAAAITVAGTRGIQGVTNALRASQKAAVANEAATRRGIATAKAALVQARLDLDIANQKQRAAYELNRARSTRERADRRQIRAAAALAAAERSVTLATQTHAKAVDNVSRSYRAGVIAGKAFNGVVSFLGGPIGFLLTAATIISSIASSLIDASEAARDFEASLSEASRSADDVKGTQERLTETLTRLKSAEDDVKTATDNRGEAAILAAQKAKGAVEGEIADLRKLLGEQNKVLKNKLDIAALDNEDAFAAQRRQANRVLFNTPGFDQSSVRGLSNEEAVRAASEALNARDLAGDRGLLELQEGFTDLIQKADQYAQLRRDMIATEGQIADATDVVTQHVERNLIATQQISQAQSAVLANSDLISQRMQKIADLTAERAVLERQIANAQSGEDLERLNQLQIRLSQVNSELERMNPILSGSQQLLSGMAVVAGSLASELAGVAFDPDGEIAERARAVEQKLLDAEAAGLDLNAVSMAALRAELGDVIADADAAARAFAQAQAQAVALSKERTQAFLLSRRFAGEEAVFSSPVTGPGGGQLIPTPQPVVATRRGGGGGRSRGGGGARIRELSEEQKLLKNVDDAIKRATQSETQRLTPLENIRQLREKLIETYPKEKERIAELTTAMQDLEIQAKATFFDGIKEDILGAIQAGDSFDDVLKKIGLRLLELAASNAIDRIASALSGSGNGGGGGGKKGGGILGGLLGSFLGPIGSIVGGLFGFEKGGIMTSAGPLPLRSYARGGVANSPQLALFGEGAGPEAFVPLPDGRSIPVTINVPNLDRLASIGAGGQDNRVLNVNVTQSLNVDGSGLTIEQVESRLAPRFAQHAREVVKLVKEVNEDDPGYLI